MCQFFCDACKWFVFLVDLGRGGSKIREIENQTSCAVKVNML